MVDWITMKIKPVEINKISEIADGFDDYRRLVIEDLVRAVNELIAENNRPKTLAEIVIDEVERKEKGKE